MRRTVSSQDGHSDAETDRLSAPASLAILDTVSNPELDTLCQIAAEMVGAQSAGISLLSRYHRWFRARHSMELEEDAHRNAFCAHIAAKREPIIVLDARQDERFKNSALGSKLNQPLENRRVH